MTLEDEMLLSSPIHLWTLCTQVANEYDDAGSGTPITMEEVGTVTNNNAVCAQVTPCNAAYMDGSSNFTNGLKMSATDASIQFPTNTNWTIELFFRIASRPTSGYCYLVTDGGDDFWIKLTFSTSLITVEAVQRSDDGFGGSGDLVTLTGTVANDGCFHQVGWLGEQSDAQNAILYLDGSEADFTTAQYYDWPSDALPAYLRWGSWESDSGIDVELTHIAFYQTTLGVLLYPHWELFIGCCESATPPLRQKQRDDYYNTPRSRSGPQVGGMPSSLQNSLRVSRGTNTYLREKQPCGC